jgi:NAD(P)-dependent dehydrogenase (short-subunit alcohol dehydrogenase family)
MKSKMFDLTGRAALVTGGSKGLGKAMAMALADAGADVVLASRSENELRAAADEIRSATGRRAEFLATDMTNKAEIERLAKFAADKLGKVDILINNAGSNEPQNLDATTDEAWDRIVELNLSSCMRLSRAVVGGMKERRWGRLLFTSSIMGFASNPARGAYSATKAALVGMVRAWALELGPYNITANCIAPGPFMTDLPMSLLSDEQKDNFAKRAALLRWGQPEELAGPALLFCSEAGSYITGATLIVDGGTLCRTF